MQARRLRTLLISLQLLAAVAALYAEPFRVAALHTVTLTEDAESVQTRKMGLNDALAIFIPEDRTFFDGVEIKMEIPDIVAKWRDCAACYIYKDIKPFPSEEQIDYSGTRSYFSVLPGKLSWIIQIPFSQDNSIKSSQYITKLNPIPETSDSFIFMRLQQVMKGIPDEVMYSQITVLVKPLLKDLGALRLTIKKPLGTADTEDTDEDCAIYIDDDPASPDSVSGDLLLKTGIHNINVISESYRTEVRTVRIDQAKLTSLEITLKSIEPTMIITAPEGTEIFWDEKEFLDIGNEFVIPEGEHKIRFIIGDYEIIRTVTAAKGKTYKANLAVDLQLTEEE